MDVKPSFSLKIKFDSTKEAKVVYESIFLEHLDSQIKSKCVMKLEGDTLYLEGAADELSILKASVYSYLRWIKVAENIYNLTRNENK
ncbi:MAG: complex subunit Pcc1 [Methanothermococcus sp.]|jgi:KEOPS complex subunit Pcc1|uniref:KEOPS complex subunit Pcc1 n=1 Tax=Methanothermococcus TaxID=155862 RepID=UPI000375D9F0|nr:MULTISPECIES: KEOPS complex subunit Pcc1 [Methanothermococcus]MDK2790191.1 complex subunit Pcc1 [Methanothermococcus sp.]MDK2987207.1 complex subunit Pcc1 [Methanothermococcus sp.]